MQDIKDINKPKKSLRDIFPEFNRGDQPEEIVANHYSPDSNGENDNRWFKFKFWPVKVAAGVLGLMIIAGLGYGLSGYFARVVVKVTPKQGRLLISNVYGATQDGQTGLKFVLASNLQAEATLSITTTGQEKVQAKASGQIIIYNNYGTQMQPLVATTRFQTSNGLIFRTPTAVKIPGLTKDAKGQIIPGQVEITVVADQAGADYISPRQILAFPASRARQRPAKFMPDPKSPWPAALLAKEAKF